MSWAVATKLRVSTRATAASDTRHGDVMLEELRNGIDSGAMCLRLDVWRRPRYERATRMLTLQPPASQSVRRPLVANAVAGPALTWSLLQHGRRQPSSAGRRQCAGVAQRNRGMAHAVAPCAPGATSRHGLTRALSGTSEHVVRGHLLEDAGLRGARKTTHYVGWTVAGEPFEEPFGLDAQAESFRSDLLAAARNGKAFYVDAGLPVSMKCAEATMSGYQLACDYGGRQVATICGDHAARSQRRPRVSRLRAALKRWACNTDHRDEPDQLAWVSEVAAWAGHSVDVLLKIYAKCVDGLYRARIDAALGRVTEARNLDAYLARMAVGREPPPAGDGRTDESAPHVRFRR